MTYDRAVRLLEVYTLQEILEYNDMDEAQALVHLSDIFLWEWKTPPEPCN